MKIQKLNFETNFPIDFFILLNTCPKPLYGRKEWAIKAAEMYGLEFRSGYTRGVFVFDDFALKFDIRENVNGCAEEFERYKSARQYGVERILLPIEEWHKTPKGVQFYIQPKCGDPLYDNEDESFTAAYEDLSDFMYRHGYCERKVERLVESMPYEMEIEWVARAVQYYGWKFMRKVVSWFIDKDITDLHGANIGLVANMRPVIFDYAGVH